MFFLSFSEIIIVVLESTATELYQILTSICDPKVKLDLVTIPDADMGTADSLRHIRDKIKVKNRCFAINPYRESNDKDMVAMLDDLHCNNRSYCSEESFVILLQHGDNDVT